MVGTLPLCGGFCRFYVSVNDVCVCVFSLGVSHARVVSVSPGPLLRVEGQPVSLRCDVTGYEGPREQDFDWTMQQGGAGPIQVISTFEPKYSDVSLSDRVASGDLSVVRLGDSVVELRIQEVRSSDSATYLCSTPSTDSVVSGNYDAGVTLKGGSDTSMRETSRLSVLTISECGLTEYPFRRTVLTFKLD